MLSTARWVSPSGSAGGLNESVGGVAAYCPCKDCPETGDTPVGSATQY
jgi:hypothetical protein